jgi:hypothetical protein
VEFDREALSVADELVADAKALGRGVDSTSATDGPPALRLRSDTVVTDEASGVTSVKS